ncbi:hypothetical protein D5S18_03090 [Nocardia panacis]|uniref:PD-(D/E)XK endonuclease-like domain-containing protein n=1 Tax=Nocardia panacis TaxID=2340916 RepID=A0A3A4L8E7_9NOCA|nr:hypothetical protein [Nocardia panacis]RJO79331.1 hypothetical protein D5S18_03090 [Nocardia panacis]
MTDYRVQRDRWGRPLLIPKGETEREPYTRASTLAKALDDGAGLMNWKAAMVALGVVQDRPLSARVAALLSRDGHHAYANNKSAMRDITERAMVAAGSGRAADSGTALHELAEVVDAGRWPAVMPPEAEGPMRAYAETMTAAGVTVLDSEPFLAVDDIRSAGSMDRLIKLDGKVMCADIKSGTNNSKYPLGVTCQTAIYAHGERYHIEDDSRTPLHPDIELATAVLIEIPREPNKYGKYEVPLYALDIEYGWDAVQLALRLREVRKIPALRRIA